VAAVPLVGDGLMKSSSVPSALIPIGCDLSGLEVDTSLSPARLTCHSLEPKSVGLELDLYSEVDPTPLLCCPAASSKAKWRSAEWVLQLVAEFSLFVGISCDGFELSSLYAYIIASNANNNEG
jgi:hypothetical protein